MKRDALRIAMLLCLTGLAPAGCNHTSSTTSATLPQRGYLWQRDWTPAVLASLTEANKRMDGVIVLGAEIIWNGSKSNVVSSSINWQSLKGRRMPSVALRVASHPKPDGTSIPVILSAAKSLCDQASAHGLRLTEFQLDYDCPQKDLSSYRAWLPQVREVVRPIPFTITSLPAWLDEPEFDGLIQEVDGYVLQVHSVPTSSVAANATLCDTQLARQWIAKAATHRKTFAVALPSYRCSAGYAPSGRLLSVAMDSVQPVWPPDTRVLELETDADAVAELVAELRKNRPGNLRELLWYRLPVPTDARNWRWPTLAAVMAGRKPKHQLSVQQEGANPIDLSIVNAGEADEQMRLNITAKWSETGLEASDALFGWSVRSENGLAVFNSVAQNGFRLPPGAARKIGWLRFDQPPNLQIEFSNQSEPLR